MSLASTSIWHNFVVCASCQNLHCYAYLDNEDCTCIAKIFFSRKVWIIFLFLLENICCGYSLEVPQQGTSNEYPQQTFLWRNKKNIMWISPLIWRCGTWQLTIYFLYLFWMVWKFKELDTLGRAGLGGSVGCAVQLETRRSRVQPPPRSATFFRGDWSWNIFYGHSLPSADSRRAVVSFWRKNVHNTG